MNVTEKIKKFKETIKQKNAVIPVKKAEVQPAKQPPVASATSASTTANFIAEMQRKKQFTRSKSAPNNNEAKSDSTNKTSAKKIQEQAKNLYNESLPFGIFNRGKRSARVTAASRIAFSESEFFGQEDAAVPVPSKDVVNKDKISLKSDEQLPPESPKKSTLVHVPKTKTRTPSFPPQTSFLKETREQLEKLIPDSPTVKQDIVVQLNEVQEELMLSCASQLVNGDKHMIIERENSQLMDTVSQMLTICEQQQQLQQQQETEEMSLMSVDRDVREHTRYRRQQQEMEEMSLMSVDRDTREQNVYRRHSYTDVIDHRELQQNSYAQPLETEPKLKHALSLDAFVFL